ncbi:sulfatase-like hydrolase/transferase [Sphingobium sp. HBC34]|uniref:Sulfatase-like hydrolase/transferase n=1 Tax=Sphingobium cyanobacteriorum TaxID=3063954 RepID=A0ABT8ZNR9_9SPHN|nr:sulfatase-like hydrolase/transferase [Sphingobium sp. HBC34]MDO7835763.1 sulfatase-like hydrolase/transferase [Sphingobium sp. HBC34]
MPRRSRRLLFAAILATSALSFGLAGSGATGAAAPRSSGRAIAPVAKGKPNIVVILVDDLDWADVSTYGRSDAPTPNIDRIARSGVAFSDGYVAASVCAVSRAALLTGRMPQRFGFTYNINDEGDPGAGLPVDQKTIADRLRLRGYRTAAFGKWHLGAEPQFYPTRRGFDEFFGFLAGETNYVDPATPGIVTTPTKADKYPIGPRSGNHAMVEGPDASPADDFSGYLTDQITGRAVDFISRASAERSRPFFAYVAYNAPHWPLQVPRAWYDRFAHIKDPVRRTYVAMIAAMDDGVGKILDTLERRGLRDDTMVVFLSDNGCPHRFGFCNPDHPFGAGKFTYLEGGTRVPFMLSWPAGMKIRGISASPVSSLDIAATILRAADPEQPLPRELEGRDLVATARRPQPNRLLVWGQEPVYAARQGDRKLWLSRDWNQSHLYDVKRDPAETRDLSGSDPVGAQRLGTAIERFRTSLPAPLWKLHTTRKVTVNGRETEMVY